MIQGMRIAAERSIKTTGKGPSSAGVSNDDTTDDGHDEDELAAAAAKGKGKATTKRKRTGQLTKSAAASSSLPSMVGASSPRTSDYSGSESGTSDYYGSESGTSDYTGSEPDEQGAGAATTGRLSQLEAAERWQRRGLPGELVCIHKIVHKTIRSAGDSDSKPRVLLRKQNGSERWVTQTHMRLTYGGGILQHLLGRLRDRKHTGGRHHHHNIDRPGHLPCSVCGQQREDA